MRTLVEQVRKRYDDVTEVHVVIEAGADLWVRLFHAAGAVVHVVDPKQAKRFGESRCSSGAKDDPRDGENLALMGLSAAHLPTPWTPSTTLEAQLDQLGTAHEQLTGDIGRSQQRLREIVRTNMPLVDQVIRDVTSDWVGQLLRVVSTAWDAQRLTRARFDEIMEGSRARKATRRAVWEALQQTEAPWIDSALAATIRLCVGQILDRIAAEQKQLRVIDEQLDNLTSGLAARKLLESVDGIGLQMALAIIVFGIPADGTGDRDQASIRMGASPVFTGSGRTPRGTRKGHVAMRRAAPTRARRAVYLIGRLAMGNLPWARAMYAHARAKGQAAATAFRRIARCLLRILTAMIRDNVPYDDARYVAALNAKGVPWAADIQLAA